MEYTVPFACLCGFTMILVIYVLYKLLRPRFPVHVNCWFCGSDTVVPYGNKNCWDCPKCEQYNGFREDGDYNKPVPAQYDDNLNYPMGCQQKEFLGNEDTLCDHCNRNQLLKIRQLASFVPYNEDNFDVEVEAYQSHLEKIYRLCETCEANVGHELQCQDETLRRKLNRSSLDSADNSLMSLPSQDTSVADTKNRFLTLSSVFHLTSVLCASLLLLPHIGHSHQAVAQIISEPVLTSMESFAESLAFMGLFLCLLAKLFVGKERLYLIDAIGCPVWLLTVLLYTDITHQWIALSNSTSLQTFCLIFNFLTSAICAGLKRKPRNTPLLNIRRLSLDNSQASRFSSTESIPVTSVSEVAARITNSATQNDEHLDKTLGVLDAFSLGPPTMKRTDSGVFSLPSSMPSSCSSVSGVSGFQALYEQQRPLISPAKLNVLKFRSSTPYKKDSVNVGGTFSSSNSKPSFLPPKHTGFGDNSSLFTESWARSQMPSVPNFSMARPHHLNGRQDIDQESNNSKTSKSSSACPVDSTTTEPLSTNTPIWKSSGVIGFVLGASVVFNIALGIHLYMNSSSKS